ncbi:hypothetical protein [Candidatus Protochlamydia amoebophila]|nr:hypothetical protein [Candidatus Protochlamydia amoebophila]
MADEGWVTPAGDGEGTPSSCGLDERDGRPDDGMYTCPATSSV